MSVNPVTTGSSTPSTGTTATKPSSTVDYDQFLQLLVAELQNQDPTSPTDPTQYLGQLASFSAVGQSVQTNQKLDTLLKTNALSQADSAIGQTVSSADGTTTGTVTSVSIGTDGSITATLNNGQTLPLSSGGVTVS